MFFNPGPQEMIVVGIVALLLFGKRLPEVARNLGKGFSEFKKGMSGMQDEIRNSSNDSYRPPDNTSDDSSSSDARPEPDDTEDDDDFTAPKFNIDD